MAGILVSMDWRVTLVCAALFLGAVIITRYVSLGSILVVISFFIQMLDLDGSRGIYRLSDHLMEFLPSPLFLMAMAVWRHRANIKRLLSAQRISSGAERNKPASGKYSKKINLKEKRSS